MAKGRGCYINGIYSNSFIHFSKVCADLIFFRPNFCSRSRNFKIVADLKKGVSGFSIKKFGELRIRARLVFPTPWNLKFGTMDYVLTFTP